jgi:hypothetical protein
MVDGLLLNALDTPDFLSLAPRDRLIAYATYVLNPAYLPSEFPNMVVDTTSVPGTRRYNISFTFNDRQVSLVYFETVRGSLFDQDGLPIKLAAIVYEPSFAELAVQPAKTVLETMEKYLVPKFQSNVPGAFPESTLFFNKSCNGNQPIRDFSWRNKDGTIEGLATFTGPGGGSFGVQSAIVFDTSPLYKEHLSYGIINFVRSANGVVAPIGAGEPVCTNPASSAGAAPSAGSSSGNNSSPPPAAVAYTLTFSERLPAGAPGNTGATLAYRFKLTGFESASLTGLISIAPSLPNTPGGIVTNFGRVALAGILDISFPLNVPAGHFRLTVRTPNGDISAEFDHTP